VTTLRERFAQAELPLEEFTRRINAPLAEDEVASTLELVTWFMRRYPTAKARLAYARRAFAQWTRPVRIVERR